jgi:hypothetical protein
MSANRIDLGLPLAVIELLAELEVSPAQLC